ncbi:hypothetical protein F4680DRAFT_221611 [Xylaria scruposa]|nr:hypothetical protein F4680DRAFT_221611 [Xylaria scruposa]
MDCDGSRAPQRTSTGINNPIHPVGHNGINRAYQPYFDNQDAQRLLSPPATEGFVPGSPRWSSAAPSWGSVPTNNSSHELTAYPTSLSPVPGGFTPYHQEFDAAPAYDYFLSTPASEEKTYGVGGSQPLYHEQSFSLPLANGFDGSWPGQQQSIDPQQLAAIPEASAYDSFLLTTADEEKAYEVNSNQPLYHQQTFNPPVTVATFTSHATPAPSRQYQCLVCAETSGFKTKTEYDRHCLSKKHRRSSPLPNQDIRPFRCSCGNEMFRDDHHKRHLKTCRGPLYGPSPEPYACNCGKKSDTQIEHEEHMNGCLPRLRRPRSQRPTPS